MVAALVHRFGKFMYLFFGKNLQVFNLFYRTDADGDTALAPYYGPGPLSETIKRRYFDLLCEVCWISVVVVVVVVVVVNVVAAVVVVIVIVVVVVVFYVVFT